MDEELYPPGMAPPGSGSAKAAAPKSAPAKQPAAAKPVARPVAKAPVAERVVAVPQVEEDAAGEASLFDASRLGEELLPDVGLPPEADEAAAVETLAAPSSGAGSSAPVAMAVGPSAVAVKVSTAPKAVQLARRRDKNSASFLLITICACVTLLIGAGAAYVQWGRQVARPAAVVERPQAAASVGRAATERSPPVARPRRNSRAVTQTPDWDEPAPELTSSTAAAAEAATPEPPSAVMTPAPSAPAAPPVSTTPAPAPEPLPQVTKAEVQELIQALEKAKAALGEQNFAVADAELAKAQKLARLPAHQAAAARLKELAGYVKQFRDALAVAAKGMQAGESFKVGTSTQVSFVEAKADRLILRIAGANKTYRLDDMPPGLALALVDFKYPPTDAATKVLKGAYLLAHQRGDDETLAKARALWEEAQAGGQNVSRLLPLLSEKYADLLKDASG